MNNKLNDVPKYSEQNFADMYADIKIFNYAQTQFDEFIDEFREACEYYINKYMHRLTQWEEANRCR